MRSLKLLLPDGWAGEVLDLSATGMRVRSLALFDIDAQVDATLVMPDERRLRVSGRVAWRTAPVFELGTPGEFGLALMDPPAEYVAALATLFADAD